MPHDVRDEAQRVELFLKRLHERYYSPLDPLQCTAFVTKEPVPYAQRRSGEKKELTVGDVWGGLFDCAWFHLSGAVPEGIPEEDLYLLVDISGEGLLVDGGGDAVLGLTNGTSVWDNLFVRKRAIPLPLCTRSDSGGIDVWIDGGCNGLFGEYHDGKLKQAQFARRNPALRALYYDMHVLFDAMRQLDETLPQYHAILYTLGQAMDGMYEFTEDEAVRARAVVAPELSRAPGDPALKITALGHSHIDLAWLWPIRETIRKGGRTLATVDQNLRQYPEYRFGFSQPQLLAWTKEYYPALYRRLQTWVAEGRIECQGAMWVECDTNLAGGEAIVRQILLGDRFWQDEFGVRVDNVWLPDVFGYNAALPQVILKSGLKYFMTHKLNWTTRNVFPHNTFRWIGIDGSEVLSHVTAEGTYNSLAAPSSVRMIERNFHEKGLSDHALMLFGVGDGGGGPGASHMENLARIGHLAGFSSVKQRFARDFFHDIDHDVERYPAWTGELYLETHRGTFTSQARNKRYNRKLEFALRECEYAATLAMLYADESYPQEELDAIWKEVLLYQFHDILPGSSIKRVYDESLARYEILAGRVQSLTEERYNTLSAGVTAYNSLPFERREHVEYGGKTHVANLPAMGRAPICEAKPSDALGAGENFIENEWLRLTFAPDGALLSLYDKENAREALSGPGGRLELYEDWHGDAWDIPSYYRQQTPRAFVLQSCRTYVDAAQAAMVQTYVFGKSSVTQRMYLRPGERLAVFDTTVEWHETEKMLRTSFPVAVQADALTCDIQFGTLKRPLHENTSWEEARFEICAHKWVDLSRDDYGVALINESKYGHRAFGNTLDIALLRSSVYPGVDADQGTQCFQYALFPHKGNEKEAHVEQKALALNIPPVVTAGGASSRTLPEQFLSLSCDHVEISAVKKAERSNDIIVRLFENHGVGCRCRVELPAVFTSASLCNMLEENDAPLEWEAGGVFLTFKPFEIHTIKLHR